MIKALTEKFGLELATVETFYGYEEEAEGGIWVRSTESSYIGESRAFNYYAGEWDHKERTYTDGVHNKIYKFLEKHGWYAEPYDAGTYMLYS